jgi:hypothetical protein
MPNCLHCGAGLRAIDSYCVHCGEGRQTTPSYGPTGAPTDYGMKPSTSPHGPKGSPSDHGIVRVESNHNPKSSQQKVGYVATTMVSTTHNSIAFQKRYVYWLGLMIFLLVLGNTHSWHLTSYTITEKGSTFRGNYTEATSIELEHDLYGFTEFSTISMDYAGTENDTSQTNGEYVPTDSPWIDQFDYRTSIETKETTIFLVNIAFFLMGISFIFLLFFGAEQHVRSSISTMSVITGVLMMFALAYFTMSFTPFEDPESLENNGDSSSSENDEDTPFGCDDTDSFGLGAFGYVEYTGCEASGFDSYTSTLVPGAGFYEIILFTTMCFLTPFAMPNKK